MLKILKIALLFLAPILCWCQTDTLNQTSAKGKWLNLGTEMPDSISNISKEPYTGYDINYRADSIKVSEGLISADKRSGLWIYYFEDGVTIRKKLTFKENKPEGPYEEYYQDGTLKEQGFSQDNMSKFTLSRFHPSGCIAYTAYYNERGREEGKVYFYYDCASQTKEKQGQLEWEYFSNSGKLVGKAIRYYPNGEIWEIVEFDDEGHLISSEKK